MMSSYRKHAIISFFILAIIVAFFVIVHLTNSYHYIIRYFINHKLRTIGGEINFEDLKFNKESHYIVLSFRNIEYHDKYDNSFIADNMYIYINWKKILYPHVFIEQPHLDSIEIERLLVKSQFNLSPDNLPKKTNMLLIHSVLQKIFHIADRFNTSVLIRDIELDDVLFHYFALETTTNLLKIYVRENLTSLFTLEYNRQNHQSIDIMASNLSTTGLLFKLSHISNFAKILSNDFVISGKGQILFNNYNFDFLKFNLTHFSGNVTDLCFLDSQKCHIDYGTGHAIIKQDSISVDSLGFFYEDAYIMTSYHKNTDNQEFNFFVDNTSAEHITDFWPTHIIPTVRNTLQESINKETSISDISGTIDLHNKKFILHNLSYDNLTADLQIDHSIAHMLSNLKYSGHVKYINNIVTLDVLEIQDMGNLNLIIEILPKDTHINVDTYFQIASEDITTLDLLTQTFNWEFLPLKQTTQGLLDGKGNITVILAKEQDSVLLDDITMDFALQNHPTGIKLYDSNLLLSGSLKGNKDLLQIDYKIEDEQHDNLNIVGTYNLTDRVGNIDVKGKIELENLENKTPSFTKNKIIEAIDVQGSILVNSNITVHNNEIEAGIHLDLSKINIKNIPLIDFSKPKASASNLDLYVLSNKKILNTNIEYSDFLHNHINLDMQLMRDAGSHRIKYIKSEEFKFAGNDFTFQILDHNHMQYDIYFLGKSLDLSAFNYRKYFLNNTEKARTVHIPNTKEIALKNDLILENTLIYFPDAPQHKEQERKYNIEFISDVLDTIHHLSIDYEIVQLLNGVNFYDFHFSKYCERPILMLNTKIMDRKDSILRAQYEHNKLFTTFSNNAGKVLSGLDIYQNIVGGVLDFRMDLKNAQRYNIGLMQLENFHIKQAPVLSHVLSLASLDLHGIISGLNGSGLGFYKMILPIKLTEGVVAISEGWAESASLGIRVNGAFDLLEKEYFIYGSIVPFYSISKFLWNVPFFGYIFTDPRNRSFIAIEYFADISKYHRELQVKTIELL
ncbi:MAG: hypothetical protein P857_28 [Candidatus Xenolissoclinum pacificiensis L6]|uniref:AsmA-like C-terminal domain-containing protein n=1 Tax=Candidatus Xenolissoclinum pacificiensis L6 TaxID=1401685 RepID=W2UZJ3_9RICK|nr:MAG: hypothetical protein P857_28 [Candidatus Xenolissoclinum pacificiensis L6]